MGKIPKDIFKAYDIRGEVGKDFTPLDAYSIGLGIGSQLLANTPMENGSYLSPMVLLGRDARLSSPEIAVQLRKGLIETGCQITDLGIIPTPALYFALSHLHIPNGLMITASHNPANHNGIKMVFDNKPLSSEQIQQLYHVVNSRSFTLRPKSQQALIKQPILSDYQQAIVNDVTLQRPLRIAIDCCNGVSSLLAESLFTQIGCDVYPLYCDLDGTFPNHSPDPTKPANLHSLQQLVSEQQLDIGIAFDGDADRMIAVDTNGKVLWPDRIMILLANSILKHHPHAKVAFDVKCSYLLPQAIIKAGGIPSMCVSGHSTLKSHMKEINAIMGGEFSGHIILQDRWSCFDDALYNAARLLELLSEFTQSPTQVFAEIPDSYSTPEYLLYFSNATKARQTLAVIIQLAHFPSAKKTLIDGMRIDYDDCWGLVRSSNTTPTLTFRFEAKTQQRLSEVKQYFRDLLGQIGITKNLPF
ncbi:MAG: phosphomannomutase/phosphoglucomutase [Cocleimonas sp.]|nr:phosphomannomutase/phosphoglucomutase [Cocleimonas sp.]